MRSKIAIAAVVILVVAALATGAVAAQGLDTRPPWENEDGIWDMSKLPETEDVLDRSGAVIGTVATKYYFEDEETYPLPVLGPDGTLVGHLGESGFWALGDPEPVIRDAYTIIEAYDESGNLISKETIYETAPGAIADGEMSKDKDTP